MPDSITKQDEGLDCNTCPLKDLPACDKICATKTTLIDEIASLRQELAPYREASTAGRMIILPPMSNDEHPGLKVKYRVYKAKDNTPVENCFVLRPDVDYHARAALRAYAAATDNRQLTMDITTWLLLLEEDRRVGEIERNK